MLVVFCSSSNRRPPIFVVIFGSWLIVFIIFGVGFEFRIARTSVARPSTGRTESKPTDSKDCFSTVVKHQFDAKKKWLIIFRIETEHGRCSFIHLSSSSWVRHHVIAHRNSFCSSLKRLQGNALSFKRYIDSFALDKVSWKQDCSLPWIMKPIFPQWFK